MIQGLRGGVKGWVGDFWNNKSWQFQLQKNETGNRGAPQYHLVPQAAPVRSGKKVVGWLNQPIGKHITSNQNGSWSCKGS